MSKAERTKKYIVEVAASVFNQTGYAATSMSDLTRAAGLTKGSFYGNFATKEEIVMEAFCYAVEKMRTEIRTAMVQTADSPTAQVFAFIDYLRQYVLSPPIPGGCVLLNTAVEADDSNPVLKARVAAELMRSVDFLAGLLKRAVNTGELVGSCKPKTLAYNIFCALEGAVMMSRAQSSTRPMQEIAEFWKQYIQSLRTAG